LLNAPGRIDECDNQILSTLIIMARLRNVELLFVLAETTKLELAKSLTGATQPGPMPPRSPRARTQAHYLICSRGLEGDNVSMKIKTPKSKSYRGAQLQSLQAAACKLWSCASLRSHSFIEKVCVREISLTIKKCLKRVQLGLGLCPHPEPVPLKVGNRSLYSFSRSL
jgi:hypothetical protein